MNVENNLNKLKVKIDNYSGASIIDNQEFSNFKSLKFNIRNNVKI